MNIVEKRVLRDRLQALATSAVETNSPIAVYAAFGVKVGNDFRIAVSVGRGGTSFFTQNFGLLESLNKESLKEYGLSNKPCSDPSDESPRTKDRDRYIFPDLSIKNVEAHEDEFRMLVADSIKLKEGGY